MPPPNTHLMLTNSKASINKHKVLNVTISLEPTSIKQALSNPNWFHAMQSKYNGFLHSNTYMLTNLPKVVPFIDYKWIFRKKFNTYDTFQMIQNLFSG